MRIIARRTLRDFRTGTRRHADARGPLEAWHSEVRRAKWTSPADVEAQYRSASVLKGARVVFNIDGNKYQLVVHVNYKAGIVFVRFVGTHAQYDEIDAETV